MKTYKVCYECILDLKNCAHYDKGGGIKLNSSNKFSNCKNKPRCFDQPERSKREDSKYCCETLSKLKHIFKDDRLLSDVKKYVKDLINDCEMRCSEHKG